jgi:glycosyltransferase involved in cell wall biosynthesis
MNAAVPDISVLVPSYGYAHFLRDGIESVLKQGRTDDPATSHLPVIELIVQDGGSTDGTVDLLESYGDAIIWRSEKDGGQSDALNRAFALSSGRWIAWLNADEFYLPGGLVALVEEGDRSGADVDYGDTAFVDANGRLTRLVPQHGFSPSILRSYGCFISSVSSIVRRDAVGPDPIDISMRRMMDWDLYLRLLDDGSRFSHVPMPVGAFRAHDTRVTATETRGFMQRLNEDDGFGREYDMMRDRYGAFRARKLGHVGHGVRKLTDGAYVRQLRARRLRGVNLRWFDDPGGADGCRLLLAGAYGRDGA